MILAALFAVLAIAMLCSLLITLTIYALPFYVGFTVGIWAHSHGAGVIGTGAAAIMAGIATLVILHILIATVQSPWLRAGLGLIFAAPAAFAAYHAVHGITAIAMPAGTWSLSLSILGAAIVGVVAWFQVKAPPVRTEQCGWNLRAFGGSSGQCVCGVLLSSAWLASGV